MSANPFQSQKLLRLMQILLQETDEEHSLSMKELLQRLESFGIETERKSIYRNIDILNQCGMDILCENRRYFVASRDFETAELHLLADAVASSRFITAKKSDQLIKKLATLASIHQGGDLARSLHITRRIKNMNETIFYLVDDLNRAIRSDHAISFRYYDWALTDGKLQKQARHDGALYTVSPWQLLWEDEFYYLVAFDHAEGAIRHYRVDRLGDLKELKEPRQGEAQYRALRIEDYTSRVFGMFGGESRKVLLSFPPRLLGAMIDRFGQNADIRQIDPDRLSIRGEVVPSLHFYGWLFSLGKEVAIEEPTDLQEEFLSALRERLP